MSTVRDGAAAAVLDGLLFVVGGKNRTDLSSVETYDPKTQQWSEVPPMAARRVGASAAVLGGILYVVPVSLVVNYVSLVVNIRVI